MKSSVIQACLSIYFLCFTGFPSGLASAGEAWYAGRWDSSLYNLSQHPHTVAIRVEIEDKDTGNPLSGVVVKLGGEFEERQRSGGKIGREFELTAVTGRDGVAVFGLLWHKTGRNQDGSDDIEKVNKIAARRDAYGLEDRRINLSFLQEDPDEAWMNFIMRTAGARYFVLRPGRNFEGYNDKSSTAEIFFSKIRQKDYDDEFAANERTERAFPRHFITTNPQVEAGPFMMLPVTIRMKRVFQEHRVKIESSDDKPRWIENESGEARTREEKREKPKEKVIDEELPPGLLHLDDIRRINSIINKSMTEKEILNKLGKPFNQWTAPAGNRCYSWQAWRNSRKGVLVVVSPEGKVTRIEVQD